LVGDGGGKVVRGGARKNAGRPRLTDTNHRISNRACYQRNKNKRKVSDAELDRIALDDLIREGLR